MNKQKLFSLLVVNLLLICSSSPAIALGAVKINPNSPLLADSPIIAKIYEQSCIAGTNENSVTVAFPMFMQDQWVDKFQSLYSPKNFVMWNNTLFFVTAGYDLGRTLSLTSQNQIDNEDTCKLYSVDFAASLVNNPLNWDRVANPTPKAIPFSFETALLFDNPLNDILAPQETGQIHLTSRLAKQNGCRYAYTISVWHPKIEVNSFDITIDMMENMLWNDYDHNIIRAAYPFIKLGAEQGLYLYSNSKSITACYE
jgi:hypothetical protein